MWLMRGSAGKEELAVDPLLLLQQSVGFPEHTFCHLLCSFLLNPFRLHDLSKLCLLLNRFCGLLIDHTDPCVVRMKNSRENFL
jgi:hypothetical protein